MNIIRKFNTCQIELFKYELDQIKWNNIIKTLDDPNTAYESFFNIFFETYDKYFPKVKIKIKAKAIQNPWIQQALQSPLKRNKSFMYGFLKSVLHRMNRNTKS